MTSAQDSLCLSVDRRREKGGTSLLRWEGGHRTHLLRGPRRSEEDSCCQGNDICHEDGGEGEALGERLWGRDCEELGAEEVGARSGGQIFGSGNAEGLWSEDEEFGPGLVSLRCWWDH